MAKTFEDGTKIDIFRLERNRDGLFLVREGNDAAGNCIVSSIAVTFTPDGTLVARMAADGGRGDNRCIGDPCSLCNSFKEGVGCSCAPGKGRRCNHEIRGVSGLLATDILQ